MHVGVRLVLELPAQEPTVHLGELDRLRKHTAAFERGRCQHDLCAEEAHQPAPLDAEVLTHGHNERIALLCAHHGEPDTGIAAGRLDYRLSRFESSRALRIFDDAESQSILDRSHGIEGFYLAVQGYVRRCELFYPHHRRTTDRLEDAVKPVPGEGVPRGARGRHVECCFVHGHVLPSAERITHGVLPPHGTVRSGDITTSGQGGLQDFATASAAVSAALPAIALGHMPRLPPPAGHSASTVVANLRRSEER